jgi:hypothetical protein
MVSSLMRKTVIRLLTLLGGGGLAGWVLFSYKASFAVWVITEAIILYLAWAGVAAIAASIVCVLGLLWSATLFRREAVFSIWSGTTFTPAQDWALELLLNGLLAMVLTFQLAFAHRFFCAKGWTRAKTFCLLAIVTNLGFSVGQCSRLLLP